VNRDRSMFQTFEWLQSRPPKRHKTIVWAATVHIAKQGNPAWGDRTGTNLGSFVHRKYGDHAYSLGFSALTGSYRQGKEKFPLLPLHLRIRLRYVLCRIQMPARAMLAHRILPQWARVQAHFLYIPIRHSPGPISWTALLSSERSTSRATRETNRRHGLRGSSSPDKR